MKINDAIRLDIQNSVLCWLATVDDRGTPNVTPKEIFASHGDDRIVIADIASSGSVQNVRARPRVCVSFVDVFRQRGFKITGRAEIVQSQESRFSELGVELVRMAGVGFPIRNIICVYAEQIARIWAPSYRLFPERSESERMQSAYDAYGVEPKG
jgi:uncharacterized protein